MPSYHITFHQFYTRLHQVNTMFEHGCAKCEKTFVSRSKLNHHNNQLHEDRECDECGKIFKKGNFARHLKVHTDTGFTCQICAKTFNRKDNLSWTNCKNMLKDCTKKSCTNVISARKHLLTSVTSRYTWTRIRLTDYSLQV